MSLIGDLWNPDDFVLGDAVTVRETDTHDEQRGVIRSIRKGALSGVMIYEVLTDTLTTLILYADEMERVKP